MEFSYPKFVLIRKTQDFDDIYLTSNPHFTVSFC